MESPRNSTDVKKHGSNSHRINLLNMKRRYIILHGLDALTPQDSILVNTYTLL